jgi:hypothetical protein
MRLLLLHDSFSEEAIMDEYYFTARIDESRTLCLAPLTNRRIEHADIQPEDTSGLFLYEQTGTGENAAIKILAHVASEESAFQLRDMFKMI